MCVKIAIVYNDIREASVGEQLPCELEDVNGADPFAVAVWWPCPPRLH